MTTKNTISFRTAKSLDSDNGLLNDVLVRLPITVTVIDDDQMQAVLTATAIAYNILISQGLTDIIADSVELEYEIDSILFL